MRVVGVSKPYDEALAQRDADLARQVGLFGTGPFGPAFFGLGPYEALLGTNVSELAAGGGKVGTATIDKAGARLLRDLPANGPLRAVAARGDAARRRRRAHDSRCP